MSQQGGRPTGHEDDWWRQLYDDSTGDTGPAPAPDSLDDRFASAAGTVHEGAPPADAPPAARVPDPRRAPDAPPAAQPPGTAPSRAPRGPPPAAPPGPATFPPPAPPGPPRQIGRAHRRTPGTRKSRSPPSA